MNEIKGTWNGRAVLVESKSSPTGYFLINLAPHPFNQFRTRAYICNANGIVTNWKPMFDYKMDRFDFLIKELENKPKKVTPQIDQNLDQNSDQLSVPNAKKSRVKKPVEDE